MASNEVVFVRIKPYNPRKQRVRSYSVFGLKFIEGKWYRLSRYMDKSVGGVIQKVDIAEYMRKARNEHAPDSVNIFDVVNSQQEADEIMEQEKALEAQQSPTSMAIDLTTGGTSGGAVVPVGEAPKRRPGRPRKAITPPTAAAPSEAA